VGRARFYAWDLAKADPADNANFTRAVAVHGESSEIVRLRKANVVGRDFEASGMCKNFVGFGCQLSSPNEMWIQERLDCRKSLSE